MKRFFAFGSLIFLLASALALPVSAQQTFNSCVENETADCPVTLPSTFNTANTRLPDPFTKLDGTRITSKGDWRCRRQEILRLAERTLYGTKPPRPATVTGTVSNTSISVSVTDGGRSANFSVAVQLPTTGTAPYPAVIRYDNSGADASFLRSNGVAVINYTTSTVGGGTRGSKTGAFYTVNNTHGRTGHLAAWAWGVSRIIDVIEQSDGSILRADAIGVTGCSRSGKGAFVAGVLDQRVALTMPMESGTGGTNIMRGAYRDRATSGTNGAQSPQSAYDEQPWLGDDFSPFASNPNNLPIDMHSVIGLIAPRGFIVLDKTAASAGQWLNIPSSHAAALAAAEIYKALEAGGSFHYINTPTSSHCQWETTYNTHLQDFIDKFLHRTKHVGTTPTFTATAAPNMTDWVNWTTPALSGDLTIGGCGPAPTGCVLSTAALPVAGGTITLNPDSQNGRYDSMTVVTVTAEPAAGWRFDGWDGDHAGMDNPATVTMNISKNITAKFMPTADGTENLVKDGNFPGTGLTSNWTLNQGQYFGNSAATAAVSGGKATINITTSGEQPYQPQLVQQGIPLEQGMSYRLTFTASSASPRSINVLLQKSTADYDMYGTGDFELTAAEQTFELNFTMTAPTDLNSQLAFNVGGSTASVTVSNVKLVYTASAPTSIGGNNKSARPSASLKTSIRVTQISNSALRINFTAKTTGMTALRIYSLKGDILSSTTLRTAAGANYSHTLNTPRLPNGFYIVEIGGGGLRERARVVVPK